MFGHAAAAGNFSELIMRSESEIMNLFSLKIYVFYSHSSHTDFLESNVCNIGKFLRINFLITGIIFTCYILLSLSSDIEYIGNIIMDQSNL